MAVKLNQTADSKRLQISYWGRFLTYNALGWSLLAVTAAFYLARPSTTLMCDRIEPTQIDCNISQRDFPLQSSQRQQVYALRNVVFEPLNSATGNLDQIVVTSEANRDNFVLISSSNRREIQKSFGEITAFEQDTSQLQLLLTIHNSPGTIAKLVLVIWCLTGASLIVAAGVQPLWVHAWVDVPAQKLHLRHQYVFKSVSRVLDLKNIAQISEKTSTYDENALYRVVIILNSDESIDLGFLGSSDKQALALKDALNTLLN